MNLGMIIENAIAQALVAQGYELYFHAFEYSADSSAALKPYEVDFLLVKGKRLAPVEVKSSGYKSHKSFDYFKEKYQLKMKEDIHYLINIIKFRMI